MTRAVWVSVVTVLFILAARQIPAAPPQPRTIVIDSDRSHFVVVTRKAGIAKSFAHDHLIEAKTVEVEARGIPGRIDGIEFRFRADTRRLTVDDPSSHSILQDRLRELKVLNEDFSKVSGKDRKEIQRNMLSENQLNGGRYPQIQARVLASKVRSEPAVSALYENAVLSVEVTIRGRTLRYEDVPARISWKGDAVRAEALLNPRFEDFGFEAYSAMLGAVRNRDDFYLYVQIVGAASVPAGTEQDDSRPPEDGTVDSAR